MAWRGVFVNGANPLIPSYSTRCPLVNGSTTDALAVDGGNVERGWGTGNGGHGGTGNGPTYNELGALPSSSSRVMAIIDSPFSRAITL